jgi:hypothetical protein
MNFRWTVSKIVLEQQRASPFIQALWTALQANRSILEGAVIAGLKPDDDWVACWVAVGYSNAARLRSPLDHGRFLYHNGAGPPTANEFTNDSEHGVNGQRIMLVTQENHFSVEFVMKLARAIKQAGGAVLGIVVRGRVAKNVRGELASVGVTVYTTEE